MAVIVELDVMLARRKMSVGDFANAVGITPANIAVLKNGRARAIRFTTLDAICRVLDCQPGDILRWTADPPDVSPMSGLPVLPHESPDRGRRQDGGGSERDKRNDRIGVVQPVAALISGDRQQDHSRDQQYQDR